MTQPSQPQPAVHEPLWDDSAILAAYQRAFGRHPDVHHMALMTWIRDEMQARIAQLESQLATVEMWQPLPNGRHLEDGNDYLYVYGKELSVVYGERSVSISMPPDLRLCRRTPVEKEGDDA